MPDKPPTIITPVHKKIPAVRRGESQKLFDILKSRIGGSSWILARAARAEKRNYVNRATVLPAAADGFKVGRWAVCRSLSRDAAPPRLERGPGC
jgi:hypothetical protein